MTESAPRSPEEIASAISHGGAVLAALLAVPVLVAAAARHGAAELVGVSVFGASALLLYLSSTLFHALPHPRARRVLQVLDHVAIYVLIAGTYTPFTLTVLRGAWGWSLLAAIWALAVLGIVLKCVGRLSRPALSNGLYLAMGWLVVVAIKPLSTHLSGPALAWLVAGGLFYTLGVPFYASRRLRWAHFVWHLFVVGGTLCHFFAVLNVA